jgi:hydrogenase-4 component F
VLIEIWHMVAALATALAAAAIIHKLASGAVLTGLDGLLRVDALSGLMIGIVSFVALIAGFYAVGYVRATVHTSDLSRVRLFFSLFHVFVFTMLVAVSSDNLGVMWVAVEGTTLATIFLVNLHQTRTSLEAGYKYLMISSVGIALAFIGTALVYYAGAGMGGEIAANWSALQAAARSLNPDVMRLAFIFILVGYGTKAGLAPMHTWLPDAHSEAPAPISALMSGVLLNIGLYAILRFKILVDSAAGQDFAGRLLIGLGLLSITVAAAFLVAQRNYKRMLAYSSVEHMGIICLALGFGGYWGAFGALLHLINHALVKSLLFLVSGNLLVKYHSSEIAAVRGLLRTSPGTAALFLGGTLILLGLPPFGAFVSELMIFRAGIESYPWAVALAALLLIVVFGGLLAAVQRMVYGECPHIAPSSDALRFWLAPVGINAVLLLALGLTMPAPLETALNQILRVLGI